MLIYLCLKVTQLSFYGNMRYMFLKLKNKSSGLVYNVIKYLYLVV